MTEKFKVLAKYIKDISSETPDIETFLFVKEKKDLEKIILCDVPTKISPELETSFLNLIHNSGHPEIKLEKKIDFDKLYNERFN